MWVQQVKLSDPSLTRAVPERFRDEYRARYKALCKCRVYLLTLHVEGALDGVVWLLFSSYCTPCIRVPFNHLTLSVTPVRHTLTQKRM